MHPHKQHEGNSAAAAADPSLLSATAVEIAEAEAVRSVDGLGGHDASAQGTGEHAPAARPVRRWKERSTRWRKQLESLGGDVLRVYVCMYVYVYIRVY